MTCFRPRRTMAPLSASTSRRRPSSRSRASDDRHCGGSIAACPMADATASAWRGAPSARATAGAPEERANAGAREGRDTADAGDEEKLLPQHAIDVGRDIMGNAGVPEGLGEALYPLGHDPSLLTKDDPSLAARAHDHARAGELEGHVRRAGEHGLEPDHGSDRLRIVESVLHGEYDRVPRHQRRLRMGGGLRVVGLTGEEDKIYGLDPAGVGDGRDGESRLLRRRAHLQAVPLHRLQVRTADDEHDVVPRPREKGPVVPPDSPRPEHRDSHGATSRLSLELVRRLRVVLLYETSMRASGIPMYAHAMRLPDETAPGSMRP